MYNKVISVIKEKWFKNTIRMFKNRKKVYEVNSLDTQKRIDSFIHNSFIKGYANPLDERCLFI